MAEGNTFAGVGSRAFRASDSARPFQPLAQAWLTKIRLASAHKKREFQDDADEALRFFDGPHDFMYSDYDADAGSKSHLFAGDTVVPSPSFRMTVNKVAEMVQLFGPVLYHRNPFRQVEPRNLPLLPKEMFGDPNSPQAQQQMQQITAQLEQVHIEDEIRARLLQEYLNYIPNETNLKEHARRAIDEAIITGAGVLWTELYTPPGQKMQMVRSSYDSVCNLLFDPDMKSMEDAFWCARRRTLPIWRVEEIYGHEPGSLQGNLESLRSQAVGEGDDDHDDRRKRGETNDLMTYWEVYSRMGMGHRMKGDTGTEASRYTRNMSAYRNSPYAKMMDQFGEHVHLAVAKDYPGLLNLPNAKIGKLSMEDAFFRVQWPIPFWLDPADPWPCTIFQFHRRPNKVWPMSHLKPGLGELKFLNWAFSFMADKIKNTSRDFIAIQKSAGEDMKTAILSGRDLTVLEIERSHGTITDVVNFLQHPQMNGDIWRVIEAVLKMFEDRVGLNELLYGETRKQLRSSAEAQIKGESVKVRPDDMATKIEEAMTMVSRKEALAARWYITSDDIEPLMGPLHAQLWSRYVSSSDPESTVHELTYRIEAGSIRKPNRDRDVENANSAVQQWTPLFQSYFQMTGNPRPINALIEMWCRAFDLDPKNFVLDPPPPPEGPSPDQIEAQKAQQEMQIAEQEAALDNQSKQMDIQAKMAMAQIEQETEMRKLAMEDARNRQQLANTAAENQLDLVAAIRKSEVDLQAAKAKAAQAAKPKTNGRT